MPSLPTLTLRLEEVVVLHRDFQTKEGSGYLNSKTGEHVQVKHVGRSGTDEDGWLYVQSQASICGWIPASHVRRVIANAPAVGSSHSLVIHNAHITNLYLSVPSTTPAESVPVPASAPALPVVAAAPAFTVSSLPAAEPGSDTGRNATVQARQDVSSRGGGYLSVAVGERLRVMYRGSTATDDAEWLFVARAETETERGWLPVEAVHYERHSLQPARKPELKEVRRQIKMKQHLDTTEFMEISIRKGESVHVLERNGKYAQVDYNGLQGWIHLGAIGEEPAESGTVERCEAPTLHLASCNGVIKNSQQQLAASYQMAANLPPRVELVTFGLEYIDAALLAMCDADPRGGSGVKVSEDDLRDVLKRQGLPDVDMIIDARPFPDPDAGLLTHHVGIHHGIIARVVKHNNFLWFLKSVKREWTRALRRRRDDQVLYSGSPPLLSIAIYCKAGKHRSVAVAVVLRHILSNAEGCVCCEPKHLSAKWWARCCGGECSECTQPPDEYDETLQKALDLWQRIKA